MINRQREYKPRQLSPFHRKEQDQPDRQILALRKAARSLVNSPQWQTIQELADVFVTSYTAAPPTMPTMLLGYMVGCLIRDGMSQFIAFIAEEAAAAPEPREDEE